MLDDICGKISVTHRKACQLQTTKSPQFLDRKKQVITTNNLITTVTNTTNKTGVVLIYINIYMSNKLIIFS